MNRHQISALCINCSGEQAGITSPNLPALRINNDDKGHYTLSIYCQWCEDVHSHGETYGMRARHCLPGTGEHFGSYNLIEGRIGKSWAEALPPGLFISSRLTLRRALENGSRVLRQSLARLLIGAPHEPGAGLARFYRGTLIEGWIRSSAAEFCGKKSTPADTWMISPTVGAPVAGRGLMSLAIALYAVSPGIFAVRLLEAAAGIQLDAQAAREISCAVAAWAARGSPGAQDGPGLGRS